MDWMRAQDVMPTFTIIETTRFFSLSSLDFNNCYSNGDPRRCAERGILFKANRVLEARLDYLTSRRNAAECGLLKSQIFHVYTKLGHVAVLAQDWVKALSAYQEAYKVQPLEFWEDPGAYYGLGLVYIHFKEFKLAADSFSRLLYSFPNLGVIVEVKARLGVCYQNLGDYNRALKFYNQALSDSTETPFLSKTHIRFNIALSSENAGDLSKAEEEYKKIVAEAFFFSPTILAFYPMYNPRRVTSKACRSGKRHQLLNPSAFTYDQLAELVSDFDQLPVNPDSG
ncbi:hypothetical protein RB195_022562 [Necator americanus]|uniref:Tetratricopeptide repeat protein n=1 Tax=Necator americanus TaxID=51031 RepID=A0ABR1EFR9_NECAM